MNVLMKMSRGDAELEAALQRAEAQISRAQPGALTASQLKNLIRQRAGTLRFLPNTQVPCEEVTLDRFDVGDYRLRPYHYEPLLGVVWRLASAIAQPMQVFGVAEGRGDDTGTELMNMGLSFGRALEVQTQLVAWLALLQIRALIVPVPLGEVAPLLPNTTPAGRQRNRSVRLRLCVGLPLNTPMPGPPQVIPV